MIYSQLKLTTALLNTSDVVEQAEHKQNKPQRDLNIISFFHFAASAAVHLQTIEACWDTEQVPH